MAGLKRKSLNSAQHEAKLKSKKAKLDDVRTPVAPTRTTKRKQVDADELVESDTSEEENGFYGFSADNDAAFSSSETSSPVEASESELNSEPTKKNKHHQDGEKNEKQKFKSKKEKLAATALEFQQKTKLADLNATSSREAHAKQKALAKERKAAKPNADVIEGIKALWEKLRLKTNIQQQEREGLINELMGIVTGRVKDLVFKHDSARVIQTLIKYSAMDQRRIIAQELKGEFRTLAEGKYSKFMVAKLLEKGDEGIRDMIIPEFYGHVRRLINHPEAAWILDDTYRQVATPEQKARLLREWYGPEFSIKGLNTKEHNTADLAAILEKSPEKRKPILDHLEVQINGLVNKKMTGFTMLHDAMLQYFLTCKPGSAEASDFLEHLKPDATLKEGEEPDNMDLLKNLAFTKSGSRLVSLAFAYGTAKDRKVLLRPYKDTMEMMVYDAHAHHVLLAALAVIDDTKLTTKAIFGELLSNNDQLAEKVLNIANDARARTVLLYPFAGDARWLLDDTTRERLARLYEIRASTSKKDPNTRLQEIARAIEPQLLTATIAKSTELASSAFGLQFLGEILIGAPEVEPQKRKQALSKIADLSESIFAFARDEDKRASYGKNMLRTLVQGGKFDPKAKKVIAVEPPLGFAAMFWARIKDDVLQWAVSPCSFVIVSLTETEDFTGKEEVLDALRKDKALLAAAAAPTEREDKLKKGKKSDKNQVSRPANAGAKILLEKL